MSKDEFEATYRQTWVVSNKYETDSKGEIKTYEGMCNLTEWLDPNKLNLNSKISTP